MTKWQEVKLGDNKITTLIGDGLHGTPVYSEDGEYAFINGNNLISGHIVIKSDTKMVNMSEYLKYKKDLNSNTLFVSINGTLGNIAEYNNEKIILGKSACYLNISPAIEKKFIKYVLLSPLFQDYLQNNATGTTIKNVSLKQIRDYSFNLPPLEIQKKIAGVLSALDDKIELNNKINNNLEQQAQALFKSWFVDIKETSQSNEKFGYIPQNATVKKIGELPVFITDYVANGSFASLKENVTLYQNKNFAYFIRNTDLKSNSFEVYVDEHSYKFLSKSSLFGNEIIISNVGDVGSVFLCPKLDLPMTLGNNIIMLRAETDSYLVFYLYIWFKWSYGQELIQGIKGGSAQPKFNKTDFKGLPVILPSQQQLKEFNAVVTPMFNKISQNQRENTRLAAIRDALLPKLMSGEIDVSNVDISALSSTDKLSFTED